MLPPLPDPLESLVLRALDSPDEERERQRHELRNRFPDSAEAIDAWLSERSLESKPGEHLGPYELIRPIRSGGMGTVYEARDSDGRAVAIKMIREQWRLDDDVFARFQREAELTSAIAHPNCVFVYEASIHDGHPFIAMELLSGETLESLVEREGPLDVETAIRRILDVVDGLAEAHRLGFVHRDIKPSNCLLTADNRVKVGDFGLSRSARSIDGLTQPGQFVGTLLFAPPEQVRGQSVDARADMYSTVATLHFLLSGKPPFAASTYEAGLAAVLEGELTDLEALREDLPAGLAGLMRRGMARQSDKRIGSMSELRHLLAAFLPETLEAATPFERLAAAAGDFALLMFGISLHGMISGEWWILSSLNYEVLFAGDFTFAAVILFTVFYLAFFEWRFGASIGKQLVGLRVAPRFGYGRVQFGASLARALIAVLIFTSQEGFSELIVDGTTWLCNLLGTEPIAIAATVGQASGYLLAAALLAITMRRSNGWLGLHELPTRTRVVKWTPSPNPSPHADTLEVTTADSDAATALASIELSSPERISGAEAAHLAEDGHFRRRVVVEPAASIEPAATRATRLPQLSSRDSSHGAFRLLFPPTGVSLMNLVEQRGPIDWDRARTLLADLATELAQGFVERSLPSTLGLSQIYVVDERHLQFLAIACDESDDAPTYSSATETDCLRFLEFVARFALTGSRRGTSTDVRIPLHAAEFLHGLPERTTLQEVQRDLEAIAHLPPKVTGGMRSSVGALAAIALAAWGFIIFINVIMVRVERLAWGSIHAERLTAIVKNESISWIRAMEENAVSSRLAQVSSARSKASNSPTRSDARGDMRAAAYAAGVELREQWQRRRADFERFYAIDLTFEPSAHAEPPISEFSIRRKLPPPVDQGRQTTTREASLQDSRERSTARLLLDRRDPFTTKIDAAHAIREALNGDLNDPTPGYLFERIELASTLRYGTILLALALAIASAATRGGLLLRWRGMALVTRDGRPASRLRCALRSSCLIALGGALMLVAEELAEHAESGFAWSGMMYQSMFWTMVALPFAMVRYPQQSIHDCMTGVWVVPR